MGELEVTVDPFENPLAFTCAQCECESPWHIAWTEPVFETGLLMCEACWEDYVPSKDGLAEGGE